MIPAIIPAGLKFTVASTALSLLLAFVVWQFAPQLTLNFLK
jgi:hypothetical protein